MSTRAKFYVQSITDYGTNKEVKLSAVYTGKPEDNTFAEATPSGQLTMSITAKPAMDYFKVGKKYYLDFTEASE